MRALTWSPALYDTPAAVVLSVRIIGSTLRVVYVLVVAPGETSRRLLIWPGLDAHHARELRVVGLFQQARVQ